MATIIYVKKYKSEIIGLIKKYLELVPSLLLVPLIFAGLNQGKTEQTTVFIMVYFIFEFIIRLLSRIIATVQEKNASKVIRVFELNKNGLAIHQIAEILETEGYRSIRGRKTLEKSSAKIIEKGNLTRALELKQLGFTELSHKISQNLLLLLLRFIVILIFFISIYIPAAEVTVDELTPVPPGPQPIGANIEWVVAIGNKKDVNFNYDIYVDGDPTKSGSGIGSGFSWDWDTSNERSGPHEITVKVWPKDNYDANRKKTSNYELYNQKPVINDIEYYYDKQGSRIDNNEAPMGTIVHFEVDATDPEHDILNYEFKVDGSTVRDLSDSNKWDWDTGKYDEGDHEIYVRVTDGKTHVNNLDVTTDRIYNIKAVNPKLTLNDFSFSPRFFILGKKVKLEISVPEEVVTSRSSADKPAMQYIFYVNSSPLTPWKESETYYWDTTDYTNGHYEIRGLMRFVENSRDEYDAQTSICEVNLIEPIKSVGS